MTTLGTLGAPVSPRASGDDASRTSHTSRKPRGPRGPVRLVRAVAAATALTATATTTTTGCGVPSDALTGISVTDDGHLLGVIMVCGHRIDGATLHVDDPDPERQVTVASWTADRPLRAGLTTWPLDTPAPGWTTTDAPATLTPGTTYALYGWTEDNAWSSAHVTFTLSTRATLAPGTVHYTGLSASEPTNTVAPVAEFKADACRKA